MAQLLSALVARVTADVPAYDSVPSSGSDGQYEQAVKDAIDAYSLRNPIVDTTTLSLVADTAGYSLPSDFIEEIRVRAPELADYYNEQWEIKGDGNITFFPTPDVAHDYELRYCARHTGATSNSDLNYADLTDTDARVLLFLAKAYCLQMQADKAAQNAWAYTEGEQQVNKVKQAEAFKQMKKEALADYERELRHIPTHGRLGLTELPKSGD